MNDSKAIILAERKLFLGKEKSIPILIASLLVIACTIAIFCQRPDDVKFVEHLYNNTHEKVAEATMIGPPYYLHPINALSGLDVQIKNKDGTVQTYTFSGEEDSYAVLKNIIEADVVNVPRKELGLADSAYSLVLHCECHGEQYLCFNSNLSKIWIISDGESAPSYKIKNAEDFKNFLKELT
jgi:hypothetical protein